MKKAIATAIALSIFVLLWEITPAEAQKEDIKPPAGAPAAQTTPAARPAANGANEIAEKMAFKKAIGIRDPKQRAAALQAFIDTYPQSAGKVTALQQMVAAYAEAGDHAKVEDTGEALLALDDDNARVMALVVMQKRNRAYRGGPDAEALAHRVRELGEKGLSIMPNWSRPSGIDDAQYQKLRSELTAIFTDAVAYGALQAKDYKTARDNYLKTFEQHPDSFFDTYFLGVASLEMTPPDPNGFWYVAKALNIAAAMKNPKAVAAILAYGKGKYEQFTGDGRGWDQIVASAAKQKQPPGNFMASVKKK